MAEATKDLNTSDIQPDVQVPDSSVAPVLDPMDELRTRRSTYLKHQRDTQKEALAGSLSFLNDIVTWDEEVVFDDGVGLTYRVYAKPEVAQAAKLLQSGGSPDNVVNSGVSGSFIYIHGGGWVVGNLDSEDLTCRRLCNDLALLVFSIDYRKVPENPYPIPITDAKTGINAVNERYISKLSQLPVLLCGSSSGGHIAALIAQASANGSFNFSIDRTILRCPVTVHPDHVPEQFKDNYRTYVTNDALGDNPGMAARMRNNVFGMSGIPAELLESGSAFPLWGTFEGHPRTIMELAKDDVLFDDGYCYAKALMLAGVEVDIKIREGGHTWWLKKYNTKECSDLEATFIRDIEDSLLPSSG